MREELVHLCVLVLFFSGYADIADSMSVEGVDVAVLGLSINNYPSVAPYVDNSIIDDRRGPYSISGRVAPHLRSSRRIEGVNVVVVAPYINDPIGDGGIGVHNVSGRVAPHFCPGIRIEGIDVVVIASYVNDAVGDGGARGSSSGCIIPHLCSSIRIEGIEVVVIGKSSYQTRTEHGSKKYGYNK